MPISDSCILSLVEILLPIKSPTSVVRACGFVPYVEYFDLGFIFQEVIRMLRPTERPFHYQVVFSVLKPAILTGQVRSFEFSTESIYQETVLAGGVLISTVANPNSFDNFSVNGVPQLVHQYAKQADAGTFCIPLNISAAGIDGVKSGTNVTIQVVFEGGDGNLYQVIFSNFYSTVC